MTPRPTIATMTCWVAGIGLAAGIALRRSVLPFMARAAGTGIPASFLKVYRTPELIMLATSRRVIATAGSLLPASGTARTPHHAASRIAPGVGHA